MLPTIAGKDMKKMMKGNEPCRRYLLIVLLIEIDLNQHKVPISQQKDN